MGGAIDDGTNAAEIEAVKEPRPHAALQRAIVLYRKERFAEAEEVLKPLAGKIPRNVEFWNVRGVNFKSMRRFEDAVWCFREALSIAADRPAVWSNLGGALNELKHTESAIICHRRAIELRPDDAGAFHNLGLALITADRHGEALAAFDRAVALQPKEPKMRWDRARSYLHIGDYARGWPEYESRLLTGQLPDRKLPGRRWAGKRYEGKRLLIVSEQGFGDAIWIARYLPQVKALGGEVVMECRPELIPLIASMNVVDRLVPRADPLPAADFHLYQCSLPGLYTQNISSIPATPYLQAEHRRFGKFTELIERGRGKLRVGIVWSGSTTFGANHDRAVSLRPMLQWFGLPGVQLYSLQKGPPRSELEALPEGPLIIDLAPQLEDFADTAAAIAQLDLVLMTDSALAHLAGAMGKPVWVLSNFVPHWLWLLNRTDSPWYPSLRLFRQRAWGDWTGVFDSASAELLKWVNARRAG
ncbi:Flp pilus assembly protein TadD [Bradyrhizobium sp. USDA 4341]